ncbi:uncharacterized protein LOC128919996 [Zeugodacus cucurbitae]|uniref:uncharacterized protein LOC128919996 n=1 Tax=Zeugodacus cucurbitae TaxID=28588 RepID=UPI0023D8EC71|nr:uncharacterized protein LOC128919996 [Zeugodacus cucurbitae]XP_054082068.1 uncharacterized protein LOC128919996 [Zeugodacus cucurbitae]
MDVEKASPIATPRSAVKTPRSAATPIAAPRAIPVTTASTIPRAASRATPQSPLPPSERPRVQCPICLRHRLQHCNIFKGMTPAQRQQVAHAHGYCLNFLSAAHVTQECISGNLCQICMLPHHTLLHRDLRRDVVERHAPRSRNAAPHPRISRASRPRRWANPPESSSRHPPTRTSTRPRQTRRQSRHNTGISSVVATLQQLQRLLNIRLGGPGWTNEIRSSMHLNLQH